MTEILRRTVVDALDFLIGVSENQARPGEATRALQPLQSRHPEVAMDLVWDSEAYDDSFHYDVLLRRPDQGTVSLSFCRDRAVPWPLRGVHRWSERDLARVNGIVLSVPQAIACLDGIWSDARVADQLVDVCLIREELLRGPVDISDAELQLEMDRFRARRGLQSVVEPTRWMRVHGLTHTQLEGLVSDQLIVDKVRERVTRGRVEEYFDRNRAGFDTARVARIRCPDPNTARRIHAEIAAGERDFYRTAEECFLEPGGGSPSAAPLFAEWRRNQISPKLAAAVFAAAPGDPRHSTIVVDCEVIRLLAIRAGRLDETTRHAIEQALLDEWLAERRHAAAIEWNWGTDQEDAASPSRGSSMAPPVSESGDVLAAERNGLL